MTVPALVGDRLPLGRHPTTIEELRAAFVENEAYAASRSRTVIWQHFERATDLLRSVVEVHAAWIGGSFTTAKPDPRDIDVLYVVNADDRAARSVQERRTVEAFVNRVKDPLSGRIVPEHRMLVDSFILDWAPHFPPDSGKFDDMSAEYVSYALSRGYWDDWWTRRRVGGKKDPQTRGDALPSRGYLEVQFSAYV